MLKKEQQKRLQEDFLEAIREGDIQALQKAYEEGADPQSMWNEDQTTAWYYACLHAPVACIKTLFEQFERWGVKRLCGHDTRIEHPCVGLTLDRESTNQQSGALAWELWQGMEHVERQRLLLSLDLWHGASFLGNYDTFKKRMAEYETRSRQVWREPPSLTSFRTQTFRKHQRHAQEILTFPSPLETMFSLEDKSLVTEESLIWCLSAFYVGPNHSTTSPLERGFASVLNSAPDSVLMRCLEKGPPRTIMMDRLACALHCITQKDAEEYWGNQEESLEPSLLLLTQRWHACGVYWPTEWPEPVREALSKIPSVRRFWEGYALTQALPEKASPSSTLRARL